ncbi:hypothetical protein FDUTEX481_03557 [Tolypothrix sp. PCC 7601]|nr:hypothetical protein FDUTEX481_03557 [Tolypothrix sp. PCC 7601]
MNNLILGKIALYSSGKNSCSDICVAPGDAIAYLHFLQFLCFQVGSSSR